MGFLWGEIVIWEECAMIEVLVKGEELVRIRRTRDWVVVAVAINGLENENLMKIMVISIKIQDFVVRL